ANPVQPSLRPQQPSSEVNTPSNPFTPQEQKGALNSTELAQLKALAQSGPQTEEDLARYEAFRTRKGLSSEEIDLLNAFWRYVPEFKKSLYYQALEAPRKPFTADQLRMLKLVNAARAEHGLKPVKLSPALCEGAEIRARETGEALQGINTLADFEAKEAAGWNPHSRLDGSHPNTLMNDLNLSQFKTYIRFNENLATRFYAKNYLSSEAFNGWMNSPGHRANILNPSNKFMGLAYSAGDKDNQHWVQIFAI
ncbi:CAP domain-containing protein, partial [Peptococcus simiae]|uniref:CAP domain-containing protein n=1 Tax=Peptococcus simiae TaxID=1643805 RepID=UPI00397EC63A